MPSHHHTLGNRSAQCAPSPTTSDGDGDLPATPSHRHTTPKQQAQSTATEGQGHHVPHFLKHIAYPYMEPATVDVIPGYLPTPLLDHYDTDDHMRITAPHAERQNVAFNDYHNWPYPPFVLDETWPKSMIR